MSFGAQSIQVEHKDGRDWVFAQKDGTSVRIANYASSSADGKELRGNLYAAAKKAVRTVIGGQGHILKVRVLDRFGEDAFEVSIKPVPKLDPSMAPSFTAKQGQYLAFIYNCWNSAPRQPYRVNRVAFFRSWRSSANSISRSISAANPMPLASHILGYMLMEVNPGMVLISLM